MEALSLWASLRIEEQEAEGSESEQSVVTRDLKTLAELFHCSSDPFEDRELSYTYRPAVAKDDPVLTCPWHRGRLLHLLGRPGTYRILARDFLPARLDSLDAVAVDAVAEGHFDRAVELLEIVAHQRHRDPVAHNKLGFAALKARDYRRAETVFREATGMSRGEVLARSYYGLGLIYVDRPKGRHTALEYFRDALTRDRGFVDARFQMAKARYEMWEYDAKSDIEKVLEIDPNYAPAYLLMGDYEAELNREHERAIPWYTKYLTLKPEDPEGRHRLSQAYLQVRDYDKVMQILLGFVQQHPEAIELLPIVAHASAKQDKLDLAMAFYRSYIDRQGSDERALYEDITRFTTSEEAAEYRETPHDEREDFLGRFWLARDPDLSTPINERLLEHYRRVWYARQTFSAAREPWDVRGEVYVRYGEPDHRTTSLMMNAQQSLEVQRVKDQIAHDLYGVGGSGETFVGPVYPVRSLMIGGRGFDLGQTGEEAEVLADDSEDELLDMAAASDGGRTGAATGLSGEGTGQVSLPTNQSSPSAPDDGISLNIDDMHKDLVRATFSDRGESHLQFGEYKPVVAGNIDASTVPWESWVYTQVDGGIEITFTDESHIGDFGYAPVPMGLEFETDQMAKFARYAPAAVAKQAMAVSPDFYATEYEVEPFDFYFDQADFRGSNGHSLVEIYYGMPGNAARYVPEGNVMRMVVKRQAALVSAHLDSVYRTSDDLVFMRPGRQIGSFVPDLAQLEVPPGTYRLEVRARDRLTGRLGLYRKDLVVNDYSSEELQLSSLELAWRIAEGMPLDKFSKKGLHVIPYPTRTYGISNSVYVYYEVYNLERDEFGQTSYRVEYTIRPMTGNVLSRLVRTFTGGQKEKVTVGYDQIGLGESETVWVELALGDSRPGRHYLDVEITDLNSGETAQRQTSFMIVE
jgi:GWxTD domain-containing protein